MANLDFYYSGDRTEARLSLRKVAELLKVSQPAITKLLQSNNLELSKPPGDIVRYGVTGQDFILFARYYAFDSRQVGKDTREHCRRLFFGLSGKNSEQFTLLAFEQAAAESFVFDKKEAEKVFAYAILDPRSNRVKIGRSKSPGDRLKSLQTGSSQQLEIVLVSKKYSESELHKRFEHLRLQGEWFEYTEEIASFIRQANCSGVSQ